MTQTAIMICAMLVLKLSPGHCSNCYLTPEICGVKPLEICTPCPGNPWVGCCSEPPESPDCYKNPGTCDEGQWCELNDRKSWDESESTTMGRCLPLQRMCASCDADFEEYNPPIVPGLDAFDFYSPTYSPEYKIGSYLDRATRCGKGLICTGKLIPALPATCVVARPLAPNKTYDKPTAENVYNWGKRWMRMGARNLLNTVANRTPAEQDDQGASRSDIHRGVNFIIGALWNTKLWGTFTPLTIESTYDELCCHWDNYTATLSTFQVNRTGPEYRNPLTPKDPEMGNAPPCVWCSYDGAYNDENPSVWSLIHALTFNLPEEVSEEQFQVLQSMPLWLREHLSCPLCRSHIKEHLIDLGVPATHSGVAWARFFWQAHNYVNEQSEVTRCGSQSCGWGVWNTPPAYTCAGVYRSPWYLSFAKASEQWFLGPQINSTLQSINVH